MDSKIKELLSNTMLFTLANLGSKVLVFLMVPFYTYILTPKEYGITGVVQTTSTLLLPIITLKIQDAVLRFCFNKDVNKQHVIKIGLVVVCVGCLLGVLITFVLNQLPLFDEVGVFIFYLPILILTHSLSQLFSFFARGINQVKASAVSGVINTFVVVVLNLLFLLYLKLGISGYLLSYAIADGISALYLFVFCDIHKYIKNGFDRPLALKMVSFSTPLIPTSLSWWLLSSFNNYFILYTLGASAVGLYSASLRIPSILTVLSDIFAQAWLLSALKNYESAEGKAFIISVHRKFFSVLCFLTGGITILTYPLSELLLMGEFFEGWRLIPLLFLSVFMGALIGFYGTIFSAENKTIVHFTTTIIGGAISVLIVLFFLKDNGLVVISEATVAGYFVIWILRIRKLKKYIDIGMNLFECMIYVVFLLLIALFVMYRLYIYAICVYLIMLFLLRNTLLQVARFAGIEFTNILRNKLRKH